MVKGTPGQHAKIRQSEVGTGLIMVHTAGDTVEEIEFYMDRLGFLRRASNDELLFPLWCTEKSEVTAILPQADPKASPLAGLVLHIAPPPWKPVHRRTRWWVTDAYNEDVAVTPGFDEYGEANARLIAAAPNLMKMLQEAVNTISSMLMNMADGDAHRNPESGEIYGDVVRGALYLEEAIKAGMVPDNYERDGVAQLIEEVKAQIALQAEEDVPTNQSAALLSTSGAEQQGESNHLTPCNMTCLSMLEEGRQPVHLLVQQYEVLIQGLQQRLLQDWDSDQKMAKELVGWVIEQLGLRAYTFAQEHREDAEQEVADYLRQVMPMFPIKAECQIAAADLVYLLIKKLWPDRIVLT